MRRSGLILSVILLTAAPAAAQISASTAPLPPAVSSPQLFGPRTLTPQIVACTDLPTTTPPASTLQIVSSHTGTLHHSYDVGDIVVLNGGTPQGLMAGQQYFARRLQFGLTGEPPSVSARGAIRTAGWLTVIAADERSALARIDFSCDSVMAGDYLEPFVEPTLPTSIAPDGPPNFNNLGRVLFGADRRRSFGGGDVLSIDRGQAQGIADGTRLAFYRDRQNGTPLVEIGTGVVVAVSSDTAKVVLLSAREAVQMGDYVAIRGAAPNSP